MIWRAIRVPALLIAPLVVAKPALFAQAAGDPGDQRILGVIPNYWTVNNPDAPFKPLTVGEKWRLFAKSTFDPFNGASALIGAASSQSGNNDPKYGNGGRAFAQRVGAGFTDFTTQNLFSGFVLASLLHEDPRYYRLGPRSPLLRRAGYAAGMTVVTRQDSGRWGPNICGVAGMGMGIVFSDLYYPRASVNGSVLWSRVGTSMMGSAIGNMMSELWPDVRTRVFSRAWPFRKFFKAATGADPQSAHGD